LEDVSGDTIAWENLKRTPNCTSGLTYLEELYKKRLHTKAKKEREVILYTKFFQSMVNLRLLQINYSRLEGRYKYLSPELKWLQWKGCPLRSLPSDFCPRELAVLDLSESKIEQVWGGYSNKVRFTFQVHEFGYQLSKNRMLMAFVDMLILTQSH
jgi:hypothetical protein